MAVTRASQIATGAALAVLAGGASWIARRGTPDLIAPAPCTGLLEAAATGMARLEPAAAFGEQLLAANGALLALALALLAIVIGLRLKSWIAAGTVSVALALGGAPALTRSPLEPVVYVAAIATFLVLWSSSRRARLACALGVIVLLAANRPCGAPSLAAWLTGLRAVIGSAGPFAAALAALGAFALAEKTSRDPGLFFGLAVCVAVTVVSTLLGAAAGVPLARAFGPALIAFWLCIAAGVRELVARATRPATRVGVATLILLLPVFQWQPARAARPTADTHGIDRLSLNDVRAIVAALPADAVIGQEDATTSLLLAGAGPPAPASGRQFAFPWAQSQLMWRGFTLRDAGLPGIEGVAVADTAGACTRITRRWTELPKESLARTAIVAVIRERHDRDHALVAYISADAPFTPSIYGPDAGTRAGFDAETYRMDLGSDRDLLDAHLREDRLLAQLDAPLGPFAARLELWRSDDVPRTLPVQLERPGARIFIRSTASTDSDVVCPAFPYDIRDVRVER